MHRTSGHKVNVLSSPCGRQMNSGRTLSDMRLGVARKNLLTSRPNKALAMAQIVLMVHQRQVLTLGELRRLAVLRELWRGLINLLGTGSSVGGRARGDINVIAPRSARSAFVTEMPATAGDAASRRSADPLRCLLAVSGAPGHPSEPRYCSTTMIRAPLPCPGERKASYHRLGAESQCASTRPRLLAT